MSVKTVILAFDIVALAGFTIATVAALRSMPAEEPGRSRFPALAMSAAMGLYVLVSLANVLQYAGITAVFDLYEDYLELLFAPLLILAAFAAESSARIYEQAHAAKLLRQQNELLVDVIDTSPVGIMIVAPGGHITFANDPARNMLDIREHADTGRLVPAAWTMKDSRGCNTSLEGLLEPAVRLSGERRLLTWPDGQRRQFLFSVTPMSDATQTLGGAVVAVEEVA